MSEEEKKLSIPRIAEAAGLDENRIIRIMEGKTEQEAVYRKLATVLDRLGGWRQK